MNLILQGAGPLSAAAIELLARHARAKAVEPINTHAVRLRGAQPFDDLAQQCRDAGLEPRQVPVQRGDVIIWHPELFHGGAPHNVRERSRRSLVMHVTPVGTPVYHIDVFFSPQRKVPSVAGWGYYARGARKIAHFGHIDFGHEYVVAAAELK